MAAAAALLITADLAGNLLRLPVLSAGEKSAPLIPLDLVVGIIVLLGTVTAWRRRQLALDLVGRRLLVFALVAFVSVATAGWRLELTASQLLFSGAYLVRWLAYGSVYLWMSATLSRDDAELITQWLRWAILAFALFGIVQAALLPGFAQMVYPESSLYLDWDPQGRRLVSTFLDPNYAGMFLLLGLCLWGGALLAGDRAPAWQGMTLALALVLTLSRGSLLAGGAAAVTLIAMRGVSRRVLFAGMALLAAAIVGVPLLMDFAQGYGKLTLDASALQRLLSWQRGVSLVSEHPWLGIGFNTVGFVAQRYGWVARGTSGFGLDGGLLFIAALTGLLGVVAFIRLLMAVAGSARTIWSDPDAPPAQRGIAYAVTASVVAITVHATFTNTLLLSLLLAPCWLLWAMPRVFRRAPRDA